MSEPQIPTASMRTCTSPGPGSGRADSTSRNCRTPYSSATRLLAGIFLVGMAQREGGNVVQDGVKVSHVSILFRHVVLHLTDRAGQIAKGKALRLHPWQISPTGGAVKENITA